MHALLIALIYLFSFFHNHSTLAAVLSNELHGVRTVYQFPNNTWVENIAVRVNGQLLVTLVTTPDLYQINPFTTEAPILIHRFPNALGALGIAETDPDIFAVITGNFTPTGTVPGSFSVWKVDMRTFDASNGSPATISKITDVPEAQLLNGATLLNQGLGLVLLADSVGGVVWGLNTRTGEYAKVLEDPLTKTIAGPVPLGINGLHVRDREVYFTNSAQRLLARVPVHITNGTAAGSSEVVAQLNASFVDDFVLGLRDTAFVATNFDNTLVKVCIAGKCVGRARGVDGEVE